MSRPRRHFPGGMVFHVLNRGAGRRVLFTKDEDFLAFERVVEETLRTRRMRLWAYCLIPNHWHFVVWPERDGYLPAFMQQVTKTHVKRWKEHRHEIGYGHLYQGRYKCIPVETEDYFYQVVRYVERNALRANLMEQAESWRWSSLRRVEREDTAFPILSAWPLPRPTDWLQLVAWFKNTCFRVTHGISARTLIGPALERVYASPWLRCWGFSSARTACTPEVPASERAAHPSATPQDSCRLDRGLHCAGTGGDSGRTEATSSSPSPSAAAGRSSCAAGC